MAKFTLSEPLALLNQKNGIVLVPADTPLASLNYFDGKFLRAEDLQAEKMYFRTLSQLSNKAGGAGVVHGFDLARLAGDRLQLGPGLAIDGDGRVLFMPEETDVSIPELIAQSTAQSTVKADTMGVGGADFAECEVATGEAGVTAIPGVGLYLIGIAHAEALCGHEDVYGKLCEEACVTSSQRPYRIEGVVLRAVPLTLQTPLPTSTAVTLSQIHLRSRVASAYFADEALRVGHLISKAGLGSAVWCAGAAAASGGFVPLGVLARSGLATLFLDAWTARRERVDAQPRRYWQWRMMMRPWDVYLAQILQFQCQLRDAWTAPVQSGDDPCEEWRKLVLEAGSVMEQLEAYYKLTSEKLAEAGLGGAFDPKSFGGYAQLQALLGKLVSAKDTITLLPSSQVLISRGIVELPSAGYLPVVPGSVVTVNEQVRAMMGEGVDLRFCVVRPDFVAHALEEAQHMQRISLLKGLDNKNALEEVDILVPDGEIEGDPQSRGTGWEVRLRRIVAETFASDGNVVVIGNDSIAGGSHTHRRLDGHPPLTHVETTLPYQPNVMSGAGRTEARPDGVVRFVYAGLMEIANQDQFVGEMKAWAKKTSNSLEDAVWRMVNVSGAAADTASAGPSAAAGDIGIRYARLKAEAGRYRAMAMSHLAKTGSRRGLNTFGGLGAGDPDYPSLWVMAQANRDLFAVSEGASIPVMLDLTLLMPQRGGTFFIDIALPGSLKIEGRLTAGSKQVVQATLLGNAVVRAEVFGSGIEQRIVPLNVPLVISRQHSAKGGELRVEGQLKSVSTDAKALLGATALSIDAKWANQPAEAKVRIRLSGPKEEHVDVVASLIGNDDVLKPGHWLRTASETAIEVLATREGGIDFAANALTDLFGTRPAEGEHLVVRATRDWVLFHRRRTKTCGFEKPQEQLIDRRYRVFQARVSGKEDVAEAKAAVVSADAGRIEKAGFKPVAVVEFDGGKSTLKMPAATVIADWQAAKPGSTIAFGAIGSQGAAEAEGDTLARARLATFEATVAGGILPGPVENQVLPVLPALGLTGLDGAIFIVTRATCHAVYWLFGRVFDQVASSIKEGKSLKDLLADTPRVIEVVFANNSEVADPAALIAAWGGQIKPDRGITVVPPGSNAATAQSEKTRTQAIVTVLSGEPGSTLDPLQTRIDDLTGCSAVTLLSVPIDIG
jgi:PAS domain-containing protein